MCGLIRPWLSGVSLDHWSLRGLFHGDRRMPTGLNKLKIWAQLGMFCHVFDESCALGMSLWLFLIAKLDSRPFFGAEPSLHVLAFPGARPASPSRLRP